LSSISLIANKQGIISNQEWKMKKTTKKGREKRTKTKIQQRETEDARLPEF
jgi:hypothetical protein